MVGKLNKEGAKYSSILNKYVSTNSHYYILGGWK